MSEGLTECLREKSAFLAQQPVPSHASEKHPGSGLLSGFPFILKLEWAASLLSTHLDVIIKIGLE